MSLLPGVERELIRAARRADKRAVSKPGVRRLAASGAWLALALAALIVAGAFVLVLRHGRAAHPAPAVSGPPAPARFPGAPSTQPGGWEGGGNTCPLAPSNRYLPSRAGCVSVLRVDVDGDGRPDLVMLYASLTHQRFGSLYLPRSFTLEVVLAGGDTVRLQLPRPESNASLIEYGNVNNWPGAELFIQVGRISSGSWAVVYTFRGGRLIRAGVTLAYGGDSASRAGFTCHRRTTSTIVQHTFLLGASRERGPWQRTDTTYVWRGPRLRRAGRQTTTWHGLPPLNATGLGVGCGTIDRATVLGAG